MAIKNYTTQISPEKTLMQAKSILLKVKVRGFFEEHDDEGVLSALSFLVDTENGRMSFKMPARIDSVYKVLCDTGSIPTRYKTKEQASRVAWRIIKDWIDAQVALIEIGMVDVQEVFFPYAITNNGETVYERISKDSMMMITE